MPHSRYPSAFRADSATTLLTELAGLDTPSLLLERAKLETNAKRLSSHIAALGTRLRLHVKTAKCVEVTRVVLGEAGGPIAVSTLKEAEVFAQHGYRDILYAVCIAPNKFVRAIALAQRGLRLSVVLDSIESARSLAQALRGARAAVQVLIEIDSDGHRAGLAADDPRLLEVAAELARGGAAVSGVMTHAGDSYNCRSTDAIREIARRERDAAVHAATRLRDAGHPASVVSVGSTPTATFIDDLEGVTEVRAGVFVFFDLVMAGIGVCAVDDIAISVLATVTGHQRDKGWAITDAGWMALSRDRGTARQPLDQGYGVVCDAAGRPIPDLIVSEVSQEHGIVTHRSGDPCRLPELPVGSLLRILPNHACATAAQYDCYRVLGGGGRVEATWNRFSGW